MAILKGGTTIGGYEAAHKGNLVRLFQETGLALGKMYKPNVILNGSWTVNLLTEFPGLFSTGRDFPVVDVKVKDTVAGSRTLGKYINAEAVATVAWDGTSVTVYNDASVALDFFISIIVVRGL